MTVGLLAAGLWVTGLLTATVPCIACTTVVRWRPTQPSAVSHVVDVAAASRAWCRAAVVRAEYPLEAEVRIGLAPQVTPACGPCERRAAAGPERRGEGDLDDALLSRRLLDREDALEEHAGVGPAGGIHGNDLNLAVRGIDR